MRSIATYLFLLIHLNVSTSVHSQDDEIGGIGIDITTTVLNRYVWRGYDLSHKDPALMTYLNYSPAALEGFTLSAGTIFGLKNAREQGDDQSNIDEFDITAAYEIQVIPRKLLVTASVLYYKYTSHWTKLYYEDTKDIELNLITVYSANKFFVPYISYFRGIDDGIKGSYVETGFSHEFVFSENLALTPKYYTGFSSQYEFRSNQKFTNMAAEFPLGYTKGPFYAEVSGILIRPLASSLNGSKKIIFCSALNASYTF